MKSIRQQLGMTQPEFAAAMGVSLRTVARWEAGNTTPSTEMWNKARGLRKRRK